MELKEAMEILEGLIEPQSTLLSSFDKEAVKTVLAELDRLQIENEEKDNIIKDVQDELRHIPSAVSEMM